NGSFSTNVCIGDTANRMAYTYSNANPNLYLATALLSDQNINYKTFSAAEMFNGYTPQEKWNALTNGLNNLSTSPGPNSFTISAGPINIPAGESVIIGFAIVKGSNLSELVTNKNAAVSHWSSVGINQISQTIPDRYELMQNYP